LTDEQNEKAFEFPCRRRWRRRWRRRRRSFLIKIDGFFN
jgi:hypothetical protein